jgi:hypothetical protein
MATLDVNLTAAGAGTQPSVHSNRFGAHYSETLIDFDELEEEKGSALAAADVIQCISIPANSVIIAAGIEVITANSGSTVLTLDLGVTGADVDVFVDGFDFVAAVAGDYASQPAAYAPHVVGNTADTLDLLIASLTTTNTGGVLRVFCYWLDVTDQKKPGLAALRS